MTPIICNVKILIKIIISIITRYVYISLAPIVHPCIAEVNKMNPLYTVCIYRIIHAEQSHIKTEEFSDTTILCNSI